MVLFCTYNLLTIFIAEIPEYIPYVCTLYFLLFFKHVILTQKNLTVISRPSSPLHFLCIFNWKYAVRSIAFISPPTGAWPHSLFTGNRNACAALCSLVSLAPYPVAPLGRVMKLVMQRIQICEFKL